MSLKQMYISNLGTLETPRQHRIRVRDPRRIARLPVRNVPDGKIINIETGKLVKDTPLQHAINEHFVSNTITPGFILLNDRIVKDTRANREARDNIHRPKILNPKTGRYVLVNPKNLKMIREYKKEQQKIRRRQRKQQSKENKRARKNSLDRRTVAAKIIARKIKEVFYEKPFKVKSAYGNKYIHYRSYYNFYKSRGIKNQYDPDELITIKNEISSELADEITAHYLRVIRANLIKNGYSRAIFVLRFTYEDAHDGTLKTFERNLGKMDYGSLDQLKQQMFHKILKLLEIIDSKEYALDFEITRTDLHLYKMNPLAGGTYCELPSIIKNTKGVINIKNKDQYCFIWSLLALEVTPKTVNPNRVSNYEKYFDYFEFKKEDFPMQIDKIIYFEKRNNIRVNVYTLHDEKTRIPLYVSKQTGKLYNLFYYNNHYCAIKSFNRFCGSLFHVKHCYNCLSRYNNDEAFKRHTEICHLLNENSQLVCMTKEHYTDFNGHKKCHLLPVFGVADTESNLIRTNTATHDDPVRVSGGDQDKCTEVLSNHKAMSVRMLFESSIKLDFDMEFEHVGEDTPVEFMKKIQEINEELVPQLKKIREEHKTCVLTKEEEQQFQEATMCCLCNRYLDEFEETIVRDHDHFTGHYFGAAHDSCNKKAKNSKIIIPIFFHNSNYDIKQLIQAYKFLDPNYFKNIKCISTNSENFKCIQFGHVVIYDSFAHLPMSLEKLIKLVPREKLSYLCSLANNEKQLELICKKGRFPYTYVDSISKLDEPLTVLKKEHFNNDLALEVLNDQDWEEIQEVITEFGLITLRDLHDWYLRNDVYGLMDVFKYYREITREKYSLDACQYIGCPALTWDAALRHTGIILDNLRDKQLYEMFEMGKFGGMSVITHKYAKANNKYLPDYDPNEDSSYLIQLDESSQYSHAMCQKLPTGDFQWVDNPSTFNVSKYKSTDDIGYYLEVDLEYPENLHDDHNDLPMCPQHLVINDVKKLAPNLMNKTKYCLTIDSLQFYIKKGIKLTKIHRIIKYEQSAWLKPYIMLNIQERQKLNSNDFEQEYYKLMNNSLYGRTLMDTRHYMDTKFATTEKKFDKYYSSNLLAGPPTMINDLAIFRLYKKMIVLDKPIYLGVSVLNISKIDMYNMHYDVVRKVYPNAKMLKVDTDSMLYYIKTEDLYQDMLKNKLLQKHIEFSNYPKDHPLYNTDRKKQPGLFQDEIVKGELEIASEFVGLRAKSYALKVFNYSTKKYTDKKKLKGVKRIHVNKRLTFEDYKNTLMKGEALYLNGIHSFRSNKLIMNTIIQNKKALDANDDKRIRINGSYDTMSIGHYKTK